MWPLREYIRKTSADLAMLRNADIRNRKVSLSIRLKQWTQQIRVHTRAEHSPRSWIIRNIRVSFRLGHDAASDRSGLNEDAARAATFESILTEFCTCTRCRIHWMCNNNGLPSLIWIQRRWCQLMHRSSLSDIFTYTRDASAKRSVRSKILMMIVAFNAANLWLESLRDTKWYVERVFASAFWLRAYVLIAIVACEASTTQMMRFHHFKIRRWMKPSRGNSIICASVA